MLFKAGAKVLMKRKQDKKKKKNGGKRGSYGEGKRGCLPQRCSPPGASRTPAGWRRSLAGCRLCPSKDRQRPMAGTCSGSGGPGLVQELC